MTSGDATDGAAAADTEPKAEPSRRAVIVTAAAGAAAVWAAPSILSQDAAAAATNQPCLTETIVWQSGDLDITNPIDRPVGNATFVDIAYDNAGLGGAVGSVLSPGNAGQTSPLGGVTNLIELDLMISTPGEYESVIFMFTNTVGGSIPSPVTGLTFTLLNVDLGAGGTEWIDDVHLYGKVGGTISGGVYTGGTYVPAAFSGVGADVTTANNLTDSGGTYDQALGTGGPATPAATSTDGNVTVTFAGPLDFLEIRYIGSGGNQPQLIGISDVTACG